LFQLITAFTVTPSETASDAGDEGFKDMVVSFGFVEELIEHAL
jgi:ethanolamine utilization microcompartment shell protein EutS